MRAGFIGLGRMGRPMAINMRRKGFELTVHDINEDAIKALEAEGARRGNGVAGVAAASDIVYTMLPGPKEVEEVIAGADGVLAHLKPGGIVVDMSTVDPLVTDKIAALCAEKGVGFVDAPVGRLAQHADRGECLFMVGGSDADFARVKPMLEAMGTTIHHCGPAGAGMRMKLVNNYLAVVSCQLNAEALALSQRFGLDLTKTLSVLYGTTATNGQLRINWPNKALADDSSPGFTIDLAHKDLTLILQAANAMKVPLPVAAAAREMFSMARATGHGGSDFSAMGDAMCDIADIPRPRLPKGWTPPA